MSRDPRQYDLEAMEPWDEIWLREQEMRQAADEAAHSRAKECRGYWWGNEVWRCPDCDANDPGECVLEMEADSCDNDSARLVTGKVRPSSSREAEPKPSCSDAPPCGQKAGHELTTDGGKGHE